MSAPMNFQTRYNTLSFHFSVESPRYHFVSGEKAATVDNGGGGGIHNHHRDMAVVLQYPLSDIHETSFPSTICRMYACVTTVLLLIERNCL